MKAETAWNRFAESRSAESRLAGSRNCVSDRFAAKL